MLLLLLCEVTFKQIRNYFETQYKRKKLQHSLEKMYDTNHKTITHFDLCPTV